MEIKNLSQEALDVIDSYEHFKLGSAVCSIPYFNNRKTGARAKLSAQIGKGSIRDIIDEVETNLLGYRVEKESLTDASLKEFLVKKNIGIDCSGFAYYILNAECKYRNHGKLRDILHFPFSRGLLGRLRARFRPIENIDVATLAHDTNSRIISIREIQQGDIITMVGGSDGGDRDHVIVIYRIESENSIPTRLHYAHAVAWPTDGEYGHGIHRGIISVINPDKPITEQSWLEQGKMGQENYTFARAQKSISTLRRLLIL